MQPRPRVHYDAIAHLYDRQPYRGKTVDPELLAFVAQRAPVAALSILDVGCGTGNQVEARHSSSPPMAMRLPCT
jgi:2-polyprenyl-3-methyl-5-hydroxy-6-metoxy-1,4-benzoquinol methylase